MDRRSAIKAFFGVVAALFVTGSASAKVRRLKGPGPTVNDVLEVLDQEFPGRRFGEKARQRAATRRPQ